MFIPKGFHAGSASVKDSSSSKSLRLAAWYSRQRCSAAAVFTRNRVQAAPIMVSKKHIASGYAQAVVVNAGCANAGTGLQGVRDARKTAQMLARHIQISPYDVLVASTGVIGARLDMKAMHSAIGALMRKGLRGSTHPDDYRMSAEAMLTTDTFVKIASRKIRINGGWNTVWGCAKGAGMIHPDMATMLAVFLTDASIQPGAAQKLLKESVDVSFNRISVDGDTSTNDTVYFLANGCANTSCLIPGSKAWALFKNTVTSMSVELARMIASDGEGAEHLITIHVEKARTRQQALAVARTVATSPLVKTAVCGMDPNWGRILAAAGRAGVPVNPDRITVYIGKYKVCHNGGECAFSEAALKKVLKEKNVDVRIVLNQGRENLTFWTCDMTEKYIRINAHYRT